MRELASVSSINVDFTKIRKKTSVGLKMEVPEKKGGERKLHFHKANMLTNVEAHPKNRENSGHQRIDTVQIF